MSLHTSPTRGSALISSLIVAVLVAGIVGFYLETVRLEIKETHRSRLALEAVNLAEIGAEDALYAVQSGNWTGWSAGTQGYSRSVTNIPGGLARETRAVSVFVRTNVTNEAVIVAEGRITHPAGINAHKQLRIDLSRRGVFANGLTSRDGVQMNGNKIAVDSYSSDNGPYHAVTNRNDRGSVASVSMAVASVDLQNADVLGYVATGGGMPQVGKNGSVKGFDTPGGVKVDPLRVSTDFYAEFPPVEAPSLSAPTTTVPGGSYTMGSLFTASEYALADLDVKSTDTVSIEGDVTLVLTGTLNVKGEVLITPGSSLTVYVEGDVDIGGNGLVNGTNIPANLVLFSTAGEGDGQTIKLSGNGALAGAVYAPFADVEMKGSGANGTMFGAVVANNILLTGNFEFHYDEALDDYGNNGRFRMDAWRELDLASERYADVLALKDGGL